MINSGSCWKSSYWGASPSDPFNLLDHTLVQPPGPFPVCWHDLVCSWRSFICVCVLLLAAWWKYDFFFSFKLNISMIFPCSHMWKLIQSCVSFWGRESAFPSEKKCGDGLCRSLVVQWCGACICGQTGDCRVLSCGCMWPRLEDLLLLTWGASDPGWSPRPCPAICTWVLSFLSWWHFINVLAHSFVPQT